jgi:integrase/recombinase XerD
MPVRVIKRVTSNSEKIFYTLEWGKAAGQRNSTGIFTYTKPKDPVEKNHNKEALGILANKHSQLVLDLQSAGSSYVPLHKLNANFIDFFSTFIKKNRRVGNRSLDATLAIFKKFIGKDFIRASEITENFCEIFRNYLLDNLNGETPADYFMRFRRVLRAATKAGLFKVNPAESVKAKCKPSKKKDILDSGDYQKLMRMHCSNYEVKKAAIVSLYSGLRWCDVSKLKWENIKENTILIVQEKTGFPLEIPLHPVIKETIGERKEGLVFKLPTQDGANKVLGKWATDAGIEKHITWHCLRHSISVLLQDEGTDAATVAGLLGHATTKYVMKTYQRYKLTNAVNAINKLPNNTKGNGL